ncbi:hypothetical protein JW887_03365 [Candidatus Dojkabacteria bacterium]|nr:hypothetical protein [Candidatus Dojkabacteria bacterium]
MSKGSDDLAKSVICRLRGEKHEAIKLLESALEAGLEGKEKVDALYTLGVQK